MISTQTSRIVYTGDGATTTFASPFKIFLSSDLKVYVNNLLKVLTTDYTLTGVGGASGGNVLFNTAPANGAKIVIFRDPSLTQETDFIEFDNFRAATHEDTIDKTVMGVQRTRDLIRKALKFEDGTVDLDILVDPPDAGKILKWSTDGTRIVSSDGAL